MLGEGGHTLKQLLTRVWERKKSHTHTKLHHAPNIRSFLVLKINLKNKQMCTDGQR